MFLTGINGNMRFYVLNQSGQRIAIGDVMVNGGCTIRDRGILPDMLPPEGVGVFMETVEFEE